MHICIKNYVVKTRNMCYNFMHYNLFGCEYMSIEFRNSLLGFNKDDVLNYVHLKDSELKNLSNNLNAKIDELQKELKALKNEHLSTLGTVGNLTRENDELRTKVDEYNKKAEALEVMSANIGKLYLVSKASAKTIVAKSEENSAAIALHHEKQLENIEDTQASLKDIADSILSASKTFVSKLDDLQTSLNNVKSEVNSNNTDSAKVSKEFADLYAKLG